MSDLTWGDALSVQIDEIDDDHRKLVELHGLLKKALTDGESSVYIEALLDELITSTDAHFKHEERLMIKYKYDAYENHKMEHRELIASARSFQDEMLAENNQITDADIQSLEDWLTGHIFCSDMDLGSFLCGVM